MGVKPQGLETLALLIGLCSSSEFVIKTQNRGSIGLVSSPTTIYRTQIAF
jgi:hypothetical protein